MEQKKNRLETNIVFPRGLPFAKLHLINFPFPEIPVTLDSIICRGDAVT